MDIDMDVVSADTVNDALMYADVNINATSDVAKAAVTGLLSTHVITHTDVTFTVYANVNSVKYPVVIQQRFGPKVTVES